MATILGLDIDPTTVRGVVLKTALRKSQISNYIAVPLPPTTTDEERNEAVRGAVRQVLVTVGEHAPDRVVTELSGDEVSIRKLSIPSKAIKKIDELLPHEIEGTVPFDPDDSVIDYQPIETVGAELRLLAAVAPKPKVRAHLEQMRALGVEPREIAVGAVALDGLVPLLPELGTPGPHCLIDVHAEGTDVCIVQNGVCHFARTLSVSTGDLDAGQRKVLEREIKQTMAAWRMEGGAQPSTFLLCGALGTRPGSDAWLTDVIGSNVTILALPPAPGIDDAGRPAFARASALAARSLRRSKHLDARQGEFAAKQTMTALRQHLPLVAGCCVAIIASYLFSTYARWSVLDDRHLQLEEQLAQTTRQYFGRPARTAAEANRLLASGARTADPMPPFDAYEALAAISASIPEEITHDVQQLQIDLGDGEESARFSLRGQVTDPAAPARIRTALLAHRLVEREGAPPTQCFREIEEGATDRVGENYRYRLEGLIRCGPEGDDDDGEDRPRRRRRRT